MPCRLCAVHRKQKAVAVAKRADLREGKTVRADIGLVRTYHQFGIGAAMGSVSVKKDGRFSYFFFGKGEPTLAMRDLISSIYRVSYPL